MKTLLIETSTEKSCISLLDRSEIIAFIPLSGGPELSKRLSLEVSTLLQKHSFQPTQIAYGKGPGSLTGVRVGAALAKALAYGWQIPLIHFCSLKIFLPQEEGPFAVLVDARSAGIHILLGEKNKTSTSCSQKPQLLSLEEVKKIALEIPTLISPHPERIQQRIGFPCREAEIILNRALDLKPSCPLR